MDLQDKMRIIQELVPGKQVTLAHVIANPDASLYYKLGLDPQTDHRGTAIGLLTVSPAETAVITADVAMKSSGVTVEFVDRFTGTLMTTGTVSEVETAMQAVIDYVQNKLGYSVCEITKT